MIIDLPQILDLNCKNHQGQITKREAIDIRLVNNQESIKQFLAINTQIRSIIFSDEKNIEELKVCSSDQSANIDFLKKKIIHYSSGSS
jgi:hypothetical protein